MSDLKYTSTLNLLIFLSPFRLFVASSNLNPFFLSDVALRSSASGPKVSVPVICKTGGNQDNAI